VPVQLICANLSDPAAFPVRGVVDQDVDTIKALQRSTKQFRG
jgi:hypothetical protein